ncbi:PAS domain-containing protein [Alteromonas sp. ASW11-36]|uniref:PAS domain-containing protein n=1 Tax=Alteromonas arenosi TaxID=3055817 RepID=A0ABT7SSS2_9ALTE|nr:PAS domain-containing protein [Alteromonas sp. ASW11-36]MDM7859237.1 PAS domain-containing protein [Alteromonas sp. ASW11-36]
MINRSFSARKLISQTLIFLFSCMVVSSAWAIAEPLQNLTVGMLNIIVFGALLFILALVITLVVFKFKLNANNRKVAALQSQTNDIKLHTDRFITGILYLDAHHNIRYANRMTAYFLGQKIEDMQGRPALQVFPDSIEEQLHAALQANQETQIQCMLGARERHVRIRVAPQEKPIGDTFTLVTIEDIDSYQQQIDYQKAVVQHGENTTTFAKVAVAEISFNDANVRLNLAMAQLLGLGEESQVALTAFAQKFAANESHAWERAYQQLQQGESIELNSELKINDKVIPVHIAGIAFDYASDSPLSARLIFENLSQVTQLKVQADNVQKQVKALLGASPLPVYILNAEQQIIDCNRAFCAFFKLEFNQVRGKRVHDIERFDEAFKGLHQQGDAVGTRSKTALIRAGERTDVQINLHQLAFKSDNKTVGSVAIVEDLSAIKALEKEVELQTKALNHLINTSPMGIAMIDDEDNLKRANPALGEMLGKTADALEQQTFYQLFKNPEQSGTAARLLHKEGRLDNFTADLLCDDESFVSTRIDVTKLAGLDQKYICWVSDAREKAFLTHKLERLINYSSMPVALMGKRGFTQLNPAACAFFDIKNEDEFIGKSPASPELNSDAAYTAEIATHLQRLENEQQVLTFPWTHQYNDETLPCEITLVPLFNQQEHVATLCMWVDLRALEQANAARLEAVNLREVAEREIAEKQQLLENSQDLLASRARSLQDTQDKLQAAESDLATKMETIQDLQQAHKDISGHLQSLQDDYARNRDLLQQSQEANAELEAQLEESSAKVSSLQKQRNQIADALQYSERNHKQAQEQLRQSELNTQKLKAEQAKQLESLQASQEQIDALKSSIDDKDKQIHDVSGQINSLQSQLISSGKTSEKLREQLINQRKASEIAEQKRRELELTCQAAEAELANKSSYVDHLQHEMKMLEQMSQQQQGDMQKQRQQLEQELQAKQEQLAKTEQALEETRQLTEQEKQQSAAREAELAQLQRELQEVEQRSEEQQRKIAEADAKWEQQQAELQAELQARQQELQKTTEQLNSTQQQTEEEKAQLAALLKTLQAELDDVEQRAAAQEQQIAQSDQQWQEKQQALAKELAAKKAQLDSTQEQLNEHRQQADSERLARKAQQEKLAQLKQEMADVESRAVKQRELMEGNDEQRRQHHAEIEKQKQQLQQALEQAESQNQEMRSTLAAKLDALKKAESTVSKTLSDEQRLQQELDVAKEQTNALEQRIAQQEKQEQQLKQQVLEQQQSLQQREDNIQALQTEQERLTKALQTVKQEYARSKAALTDQSSSQEELTAQLKALEAELNDSKQQLTSKESALQEAQQQIASSADKLAAQEQALIDAQKQEIKQVSEQQAKPEKQIPEFAKLPMPDDPTIWFDLLPYLQQKQSVTSLAVTLQSLIDEFQQHIEQLDKAIEGENDAQIQLAARKLIRVLEGVPSAPLSDMANRLQSFCENRMIDNIAILWPTAKQNLFSTLRVIYSHLNAEID